MLTWQVPAAPPPLQALRQSADQLSADLRRRPQQQTQQQEEEEEVPLVFRKVQLHCGEVLSRSRALVSDVVDLSQVPDGMLVKYGEWLN